MIIFNRIIAAHFVKCLRCDEQQSSVLHYLQIFCFSASAVIRKQNLNLISFKTENQAFCISPCVPVLWRDTLTLSFPQNEISAWLACQQQEARRQIRPFTSFLLSGQIQGLAVIALTSTCLSINQYGLTPSYVPCLLKVHTVHHPGILQ